MNDALRTMRTPLDALHWALGRIDCGGGDVDYIDRAWAIYHASVDAQADDGVAGTIESRIDLLDDLEDTRLEMRPHHSTWSSVVGRAIDLLCRKSQREGGHSDAPQADRLGMVATPLPVRDDGALALVLLSRERMEQRGLEYYGDPVVVSRWGSKLKTTVHPMRLGYEDVVAWRDLSGDTFRAEA